MEKVLREEGFEYKGLKLGQRVKYISLYNSSKKNDFLVAKEGIIVGFDRIEKKLDILVANLEHKTKRKSGFLKHYFVTDYIKTEYTEIYYLNKENLRVINDVGM